MNMVDVLLLLLEHKVTLVCFFKVTVSDGVTGLIKGYWRCAANREPVHRKKTSLCESWLTGSLSAGWRSDKGCHRYWHFHIDTSKGCAPADLG